MTKITETSLAAAMTAISGAELEAAGAGDPLDLTFEEMGFDSLARQELMGRVERTHGIRFPADLVFSDTSTPRELLAAADEQEDATA
ncbi:acyl carrier protein [Nocardia sp. NPDC051570]|uniref:acyl carrier protein n=1 Tax=Nocardia sp. NPDC051570 TaxID=3364324 RepID=UPI0037B68755